MICFFSPYYSSNDAFILILQSLATHLYLQSEHNRTWCVFLNTSSQRKFSKAIRKLATTSRAYLAAEWCSLLFVFLLHFIFLLSTFIFCFLSFFFLIIFSLVAQAVRWGCCYSWRGIPPVLAWSFLKPQSNELLFFSSGIGSCCKVHQETSEQDGQGAIAFLYASLVPCCLE
jgi:hypothetical protein